MLVLHGILGSGTNFRTFARRLATALPDWGFVLPDLRMHGQSQGAPAEHTINSSAADLVRLTHALGLNVRGVMGHSYGGKVALEFVEIFDRPLSHAVVLDAQPGPRPFGASTAETVIATLKSIVQPLPSRERFFEILTERGHTKGIMEWLAMNLRRADDGFRLRLDLTAIDAMIADYNARDLWPVVESTSRAPELTFVAGGTSATLSIADRERIADAYRASVHVLPNAGHWVHVDDPEGLFAAVHRALEA